MNRAPSNRDRWWGQWNVPSVLRVFPPVLRSFSAEHERRCGGQFEKIKEPDQYKNKDQKKTTNETKTSPVKTKKKKDQGTIEKFFKKTPSVVSSKSPEKPVVLKRSNENETEERTRKMIKSTGDEVKVNYVRCPKCEILLPKANVFLHEIRCQK